MDRNHLIQNIKIQIKNNIAFINVRWKLKIELGQRMRNTYITLQLLLQDLRRCLVNLSPFYLYDFMNEFHTGLPLYIYF